MKTTEDLIPTELELDCRWAEHDFGQLDLGDVRRTIRLVRGLNQMMSNPGKSVSEMSESWSEAKCFYRLLGNPELTAESILEPHGEGSLQRALQSEERVLLAVQDTTTLNFTTHEELEDQGPIGSRDRPTGLHLHNTLLMGAESGHIFGLLGAQLYARDGRKRRSQKPGTRNREGIESKESYRWLQSFEMAREAWQKLQQQQDSEAAQQAPFQLISVGDREADIYELILEACQHRDQGLALLVRSQHNRVLEGDKQRMWDQLSAQPAQGELTVTIPKSRGIQQQELTLTLRCQSLRLEVPAHKRKYLKMTDPLEVTVIELKEAGKEDGVHWKLLTTLEVSDADRAAQIAGWYARRWQIEVLHRILKTGCRVERRQMRTMDTLRPMIAMDLVVAASILSAVTAARAQPDSPASGWFSSNEVGALKAYFKLKLSPGAHLSIAEAVKWTAKLGGHLGRKNDGPPGPEVLWRGIRKLENITEAWLIFTQN